jgi:hypothetical protein
MEASTYTDIAGVLKWTIGNVCDIGESRVTLYGQCNGIGASCYMGVKTDGTVSLLLLLLMNHKH